MTVEEMMDLGFSEGLINQLTEITDEIAKTVQQVIAEEEDNYVWAK